MNRISSYTLIATFVLLCTTVGVLSIQCYSCALDCPLRSHRNVTKIECDSKCATFLVHCNY